jgi:hypothetical protein
MKNCSIAIVLMIIQLNVIFSFKRISLINRKFLFKNFSKKVAIRPTLDDVERISMGKAAKRRGTGSRNVPHRLNEMERKEWELAKTRKYLLLRGTGWRKERGDSPLANIYRNYCDALGIMAISVTRGLAGSLDTVTVDFSPLREINVEDLAASCIKTASEYQSFVNFEDYSNIKNFGWENPLNIIENDVIWRIPAYFVNLTFSDRSDGKNYASRIAETFICNEKKINHNVI